MSVELAPSPNLRATNSSCAPGPGVTVAAGGSSRGSESGGTHQRVRARRHQRGEELPSRLGCLGWSIHLDALLEDVRFWRRMQCIVNVPEGHSWQCSLPRFACTVFLFFSLKIQVILASRLPNFSFTKLSKHFRRCGWTACQCTCSLSLCFASPPVA